jgi:hypothetical protein
MDRINDTPFCPLSSVVMSPLIVNVTCLRVGSTLGNDLAPVDNVDLLDLPPSRLATTFFRAFLKTLSRSDWPINETRKLHGNAASEY